MPVALARFLRFALASAAVAGSLAMLACGTDALGVDACRRVEEARCRKAPICSATGVTPGDGVEQCVRFYRDQCLHGLPAPDPGSQAVDRCVRAIDGLDQTSASSCDLLLSPQTLPDCLFLAPSAAPADAGTEGSTVVDDAQAGDAPPEG